MQTFDVRATYADPEALDAWREAMLGGAIGLYPTAGLYGLGVDARCLDAIARLVAWKGRAVGAPMLVLADRAERLAYWGLHVPDRLQRLTALWPGALTMCTVPLPGAPIAWDPALVNDRGEVAVRIDGLAVTRMLCACLEGPLVSTSANRSGEPPARTFDEALASTADVAAIAMRLTASEPTGVASTLVRWDLDIGLEILREGAISEATLRAALS